jgi:hypothetical protein
MRQPSANFRQMLVTVKVPTAGFPSGPVRREDRVAVVTHASGASCKNSVAAVGL